MKLKERITQIKTKVRGPTLKERFLARKQEAAALKVALDALTPAPPTGS